MTTILADAHKGIMVSDSNISNGDRVWIGRKVIRYKGVLFGFSGDCLEAERFMEWVRAGSLDNPPSFTNSECLMLQPGKLTHFLENTTPSIVRTGIEAIGTGAKAAMCTYEALEFQNPKRAVSIVCHNDSNSRLPVRTYKI